MSKKFHDLIPGIVLLAATTIFPMALASAQAVSLQEQLAAQYKLAKIGIGHQRIFRGGKGHIVGHPKGRSLGRALWGPERSCHQV